MKSTPPIHDNGSDETVQSLLELLERRWGMVPSLARVMARSPAVLKGYVQLTALLRGGALEESMRELIGLTVAEQLGSKYCVSGHVAVGRSLGLSGEALLDARLGLSPDRRTNAVLQFARQLVRRPGEVNEEAVLMLQEAGFRWDEICEIVAAVGLSFFLAQLSLLTQPAPDFESIPLLKDRSNLDFDPPL